jgi:acyl-CoA reductase-like NAD-dependent aldehyde dehydrogenase
VDQWEYAPGSSDYVIKVYKPITKEILDTASTANAADVNRAILMAQTASLEETISRRKSGNVA